MKQVERMRMQTERVQEQQRPVQGGKQPPPGVRPQEQKRYRCPHQWPLIEPEKKTSLGHEPGFIYVTEKTDGERR